MNGFRRSGGGARTNPASSCPPMHASGSTAEKGASMTNVYETTVSHVTEGDVKDAYVLIESTERAVIGALESKPDRFEVVHEDNTPGCPRLVRFRIPITDVNWAGLARRRGSPRPHLRALGDSAAARSGVHR